jgi:hypothetical protein
MLLLLLSIVSCQLLQNFNFFIQSPTEPFRITFEDLVFTWETDSCAGSVDGGGNVVSNPIRTSRGCEAGGRLLGPGIDAERVFPNGFDRM